MSDEENKNLAEIPINGFPHQTGGIGVTLTFDWIEQQMKLFNHMEQDEVFSQVNVTEDGVVFYISKQEIKH